MRIVFIAPGSQGDVRPYLALGLGLQADGHRVRIASNPNFELLVTARGLSFSPLHGDTEAILRDRDVGHALAKGNPLAQLALLQKKLIALNVQWMRDSLEAGRGADLIAGGFGGLMVGQPVAEKLGLPFLQTWLVPFLPTREFPAATFPGLRRLAGGRINRLSHILGWRWLAWPMQRGAINAGRRDVLGLPAAPHWDGPLAALRGKTTPVLHGFSRHVIPRPADWADHLHVTGYWFLDPPEDWRPPAELEKFLDAGPPPVYIGFGSMTHGDPRGLTRTVLDALRLGGQRGILLSGWAGLSTADRPGTVHMVDSIPHSWLFPRLSAVIHHGGAGTTAAGMRAGVPSIITPFISLDQNFWAARAADLGVGLPPLTLRGLTAEKLARAITAAVSDPELRRNAAALGAKLRAEDGVASAVAIVRTQLGV